MSVQLFDTRTGRAKKPVRMTALEVFTDWLLSQREAVTLRLTKPTVKIEARIDSRLLPINCERQTAKQDTESSTCQTS